MTDNIQIIENNDLNTLNKEILKFTILVTHFETQPEQQILHDRFCFQEDNMERTTSKQYGVVCSSIYVTS